MARIIAITNQKGGVGKTTTSVNLSACVAAEGRRVLVVDADPQGNTSSGLGVRVREKTPTIYEVMAGNVRLEDALVKTAQDNLMLLPSDIRLAGAEIELADMDRREHVIAQALSPAADRFDEIFIDCPPSLGLITLNALCAADGVLIPIQCEYYALEDVYKRQVHNGAEHDGHHGRAHARHGGSHPGVLLKGRVKQRDHGQNDHGRQHHAKHTGQRAGDARRAIAVQNGDIADHRARQAAAYAGQVKQFLACLLYTSRCV